MILAPPAFQISYSSSTSSLLARLSHVIYRRSVAMARTEGRVGFFSVLPGAGIALTNRSYCCILAPSTHTLRAIDLEAAACSSTCLLF
jgi:hypothetical protein